MNVFFVSIKRLIIRRMVRRVYFSVPVLLS